MRRRGISKSFAYVLVFVFAIVVLAIVQYFRSRPTPRPVVATQPASAPTTTTAPSTTQAVPEPIKVVDLLSLVRSDNPDYPTTQPFDMPVDLHDAAKIVLNRPVYLDPAGRLWITHPDGVPVEDLLRKFGKSRTLIVKETVVFVHYTDSPRPAVFVRESQEKVVRIADRKRQEFADRPDRRWNAALVVGKDIAVPNDVGVSIFRAGAEAAQEINLFSGDPPANHSQAVIASTGDAILAWCPFDNGKPGSPGAWLSSQPDKPLNAESGWFEKPIHFVPLSDGSILGLGAGDGIPELKLKSPATALTRSDQQKQSLRDLARKLADRDPRVREQTQREIELLGPGVLGELEELRDTLPPEAQVRIEAILGQRFTPTIAGLRPLEGLIHTVSRFPDGGCVLLLTGGGTYTEDGEDKTLIPAWISIRPGQFIQRLPDSLTSGVVVGRYQYQAFGSEWLLIDPVLGPRRYLGAKYQTLLGKDLRHFDRLVGIDANQRWLFRSAREPEKTLILEPALPDLTPRLPLWAIDAKDGAGWTTTGWPAVKMDKRLFVLGEGGWRMLDEKTEKFETKVPDVIPTVAIDPTGRRFEWNDGTLKTIEPDGSSNIQQVLAPGATMLFYSSEHLFLVAPGKVYRWRPPAPGKVSNTAPHVFEKNIPGDVKRVWLDPAGRLIFGESAQLWVAFPAGRIPRPISQLMLQKPEDDQDD